MIRLWTKPQIRQLDGRWRVTYFVGAGLHETWWPSFDRALCQVTLFWHEVMVLRGVL